MIQMNPKTSKEILDIMGKKAAPKKGYLNILVGNNVRNIRSNQKMFNKLGKSAPNLLETNNFLINSLEKNHNAHVADWKKYLDTTPMAEWDQKRLKNYDETAKRIRADIKKAKDNKESINHFIDSYTKTKDAVNADYNKALKKERVKTMLTQLGTGGGIGLAGKMVGRKFDKQKIDKEASVYLDAIDKVAGKVIPFPNGRNIKNITNKSKLKPSPEYFLMANPPEKLLVGSLPGIAAGQIAGAKLYHKLNPSRKRTKKACLYSDAIEKIAGEVIKFPNANKRLINKGSKMVEKLKFKNWNPYLKGAAAGVGLGLPFGYLDQSIKSCNKKQKQ